MTRRIMSWRMGALAPLCALVLLALSAPGARGQIHFGIHAARVNKAVNGVANGVGASLELGIPVFPVGVMAAGEWFHPDCGNASGCSYMGAGVDIHVTMPAPVVQPYALAGVVMRRVKESSAFDATTDRGMAVGVGVNLRGLVMGAYGEARYEFVTSDHPFVLRIGLRF